MSRKPKYFPKSTVAPIKGNWYTIPFFSGYQISIPDFTVRDMRCEDYPNGVIVGTETAKSKIKFNGDKFVKIVGDDGIYYKAFLYDLYDLIVSANNSKLPDKLPLCFKPIGNRNYKEKNDKVREYWREKNAFIQ